MTVAFEHDLGMIKMNEDAKCLSQRSFSSYVIVRTHTHTHTHTHTYTGLNALLGPLKWSVRRIIINTVLIAITNAACHDIVSHA